MEILFDKSFLKSLHKLNDKAIIKKIEKVIVTVEFANSLVDIPNNKKLKGFATYYRIRIGDYRLGLELVSQSTVRFIVVLHRKDIYQKFP